MQLLKKLREETRAPIHDCKSAIEESGGNYERALEIIKGRGLGKALKKAERATGAGIVEAYIHGGGRIGVLVELLCETDFVARNEMFKELAHNVAMQVAAMDPQNSEELNRQPYIKDSSITIGEMVQGAVGKIGENIKVGRFVRYEI